MCRFKNQQTPEYNVDFEFKFPSDDKICPQKQKKQYITEHDITVIFAVRTENGLFLAKQAKTRDIAKFGYRSTSKNLFHIG